VRCHSCGREYGQSLLGLEWCPGDRAYFCTACTRERQRCPSCKARPAGIHLGLAGFLLLVILVTSSILILPQHFSRTWDIQMPVSNINNTSVGQDVRIYGQIECPQQIAFSLMYKDQRWQLQYHSGFNLTDPKGGKIRPDMTMCRDFTPLFHNLSDRFHSKYLKRDNVTVFGKVGEDFNGDRTIDVRRIYPGAKDPYEMEPGWYQTLWLIPAVSLILLIQVLVIYGHRRWLHRAYQDKRPEAQRPRPEEVPAEKDVAWNESPLLSAQTRIIRRLGVLSLILLAIILSVSVLVPGAWYDYPVILVVLGIIMVFSVTFTYLHWEMTHDTPAAVGFSRDAVHFRFKPGKKTPDQYQSVPWKEIESHTANPERKTAYIKLHTEQRIYYVIIPKGLIKDLDERSRKARAAG
jgi:hypothetical protein